jgi:hypothetical protein
MENLSEQVKRAYAAEVRSIKNAGSDSWMIGVGVAISVICVWACNFFFGWPWTRNDLLLSIIVVVVFPFGARAWDRHKVAARMRHEREVRMEVMLDALIERVKSV